MNTASFKGDIRLKQDEDGDWVIDFQNGQPIMTEFFDTTVLLYMFGIDSWYNDIVDKEPEKMKSLFPVFINSATVTDSAVSTGRKFLIEALQPLITKKIAKSVGVVGEIISIYVIAWTIYITKFDGEESKFSITWEKGAVMFEALS